MSCGVDYMLLKATFNNSDSSFCVETSELESDVFS